MNPVCIFIGTRPEIIKTSGIIKLLLRKRKKFILIHTNQHATPNMDKVFFEELGLPPPNYNLNVKSGTNASRFGEIVGKAEKIFTKVKPGCVLVQGDTDSVLAGAITAWKLGIKIGHIEAGLRSYDRTMPEELNRKVTDHLSDFLFVPTKNQKATLLSEGIEKNKIYVTGNTIVDVTLENLKLAESRPHIAKAENYLVLTLHRPSNVDNKKVFLSIVKALSKLGKKTGYPIYFPIHPRTKKMIKKFSIKLDRSVFKIMPPLGYLDMLNLERNAKLILTDSGGVQEEACVLRVPCVTIRDNTERPETVDIGANVIAGTGVEIFEKSLFMLGTKNNWQNPYGKGYTSQKIIDILESNDLV